MPNITIFTCPNCLEESACDCEECSTHDNLLKRVIFTSIETDIQCPHCQKNIPLPKVDRDRRVAGRLSKSIRPKRKREETLVRFLNLTDTLCLKYGIRYDTPYAFWLNVRQHYLDGRIYYTSDQAIWKQLLSVSQDLCDHIIYDPEFRKTSLAETYLSMPVEITKLLSL